jgi:hypothetical protein
MARETDKKQRAASLFDLRRVIGGLFLLYGAILTVAGAVASDADIHKAADVNINLWTGLGMLVVGGLFVLWLFLRPLRLDDEALEAEPQHSEEPRRRAGHDAERVGGRVGAGREQA